MDTSTLISPLRFPLGENVYAYVKTWKGCAKIHIRHFAQPTNTKGGSVVATVKGVKMDLKMFNRLCKMKKKLAEEFRNQNINNNKQKKQPQPQQQQQQQQQQPQRRTSRPAKKRRLGADNNNNNNAIQQTRTDLCLGFGNFFQPTTTPSTEEEEDARFNNNLNNNGQCQCLSALTPKLFPSTTTTTAAAAAAAAVGEPSDSLHTWCGGQCDHDPSI